MSVEVIALPLSEYIKACTCFIGALFLVRNSLVYRWRMWFLDGRPYGTDLYDCLPSYGAMVFWPGHWLKWSQSTWLGFVVDIHHYKTAGRTGC